MKDIATLAIDVIDAYYKQGYDFHCNAELIESIQELERELIRQAKTTQKRIEEINNY